MTIKINKGFAVSSVGQCIEYERRLSYSRNERRRLRRRLGSNAVTNPAGAKRRTTRRIGTIVIASKGTIQTRRLAQHLKAHFPLCPASAAL